MKAIRATRAVTPYDVLNDVTLWLDQGQICKIEHADVDDRTVARGVRSVNGGADELIDANGLTLLPGLIDIHTHGADGVLAIDGTQAAYEKMACFYARHGVTGFLAGVFGSRQQIEGGIDAAIEWMRRADALPHANPGAGLLGIYLEGPFLDPGWAGAFVPETIIEPDAEILLSYIERAEGRLRLLTIAPELPGADGLIWQARRLGVVCALGHSGATYEQALAAADAGVRHVTHTYNALPGLHHRMPGAVGAALTDDRFTVEIIADGVHVHPAAINLLTRAKRLEDIVIITDSVAAAGLPDGEYAFTDVEARVQGDEVRLADGTLAGSKLTMERGVMNLVEFGAISLPQAVAMATTNPARVIGLEDRKGRLIEGYDADIVAVTQNLEVVWTMVGGRIVYRAPAIP